MSVAMQMENEIFCDTPIPLYFFCDPRDAISAFNGQFNDKEHNNKKGVLLSNMPCVNGTELCDSQEQTLVRIALHDISITKLFHKFEIAKLGNGARKFVIPAELLQGACEVELLCREQWDDELALAEVYAWNQYPPGEPIRTLTSNLGDKQQEIANVAIQEGEST